MKINGASPSSMAFCFPKARRILRGRDFLLVFQNKKRLVFRAGSIRLICAHNDRGYSRLGLVVSRRSVRLSVLRNRFKRVAREHFRLTAHKHESLDVIIRVISPPLESDWHALSDIFSKLYQNIEKPC